MSFHFEINRVKSVSIGELWFEINDKKYDFKFQVCTPDCDDCSENLNAHYFVFTDTNEFGAKNNYVEYIDCFSVLASKIDSFDRLRLFKFSDVLILLPINKPNSNKIYDIIKQVKVVLNIGNPAIPAAIPPAKSLIDRAIPNKYISNQLIVLYLFGLFTST